MIKIFCKPSQQLYLLLGMETEYFSLVDSPWTADIIFVDDFFDLAEDNKKWKLPNLNSNQVLIWPALWHGVENDTMHRKVFDHFLQNCHEGTLIMLCQYQKFAESETLSDRIKILSYDIMFNRTKAYFSQLPFHNHFVNSQPSWYWAGNNCYTINHWSRESQHRSRIFLSASRPYAQRNQSIRSTLQKHLQNHIESGYVAIYDSDKVNDNITIGLYSHKEDPVSNGILQFDITSGKVIELSEFIPLGDSTRGFAPIHLNYFEDSFLSIYEETVIYGTNVFVTEKTFVPLIQGHFILPFSNAGTIDTIKDMGFMLPDFIDYSYDTMHDLDERKKAYMQEVDRLINQSRDWWIEKRDKNLDLLYYNRRFFWNRPYDQFIPTAKIFL